LHTSILDGGVWVLGLATKLIVTVPLMTSIYLTLIDNIVDLSIFFLELLALYFFPFFLNTIFSKYSTLGLASTFILPLQRHDEASQI